MQGVNRRLPSAMMSFLIFIISSFPTICKGVLYEGDKICGNCTKNKEKQGNYMDKMREGILRMA